MAGPVYPERAALLLEIQSAAIRNAALRNAEPRNAVLRNAVLQSAVIQNVALRSAVIQSAVIRDVALIVVPTLALNAVLIVAVIQVLIPGRVAQSADFHAAVPSLARAYLQEHSRLFPVVAHVFPIRPRGRGLGVAEAQAELQRRLVEFLRWSQEQGLLPVLLAPLRLVDSLRALSARVRERLSSS